MAQATALLAPVLCIAAAGAAEQAQSAARGVPTAADYARKSKFLTAKISPDGASIAVTFWHDDAIALGVLDLKSLKTSGSVWFTRGNHVADYWWVSGKRLVFSIGKSDGALDQIVRTGELYAMDADGSHKQYLYGYQGGTSTGSRVSRVTAEYGYATMVDPMPGDPDHALIAVNAWDLDTGKFLPDVDLYQIDIRDGQKRRVSYIKGNRNAGSGLASTEVVTAGDGQPRYAVVERDDGSLIEMKRLPPGDQWVSVREHDRHVRVHLLGVSADLAKVYLLSSEGSDRICARVRDLASGALETLSCNDQVDATVAFSASDGRPLAVDYEIDRPQAALIGAENPELKAYRMLQKAFPGQRIEITSRTLDGGKLVVLVDSDRNPGDFYLFDLATMHANYLFSHSEWVDPETMTRVLPVDIKARDGLPLHGYVTSHGGLKPERRPLVVLVHGGPHQSRDRWEWQSWPQYLASLGYAVLQVNYRGSGGYGDAFEAAGYRKWGTTMQDDLADAVRWSIDAGIADAGRICIMGASYGGYAALMSAVREPGLYHCAIAFAGPVDLVTQSKDSDISETGFGRMYLKTVLGNDDATLRQHSPITYLDKLQAPVLIAHGTMDERVPFSQAEELRDALDRLHKPYEWLPFKGEEHGFYADANAEKFLLAVKAFLEKNIGAGAGSGGAPVASGSAAN
ncbi:MAG: alpha/beta fold hydrolase [Solimonas sp.]